MLNMDSVKQEIFIVSDLHIGGDGIANEFEAQDEFVEFLNHLTAKSAKQSLELIILGDFLGLWEIQEKSGIDKLKHIVSTHGKVFNALKDLSVVARITLVPGNHDHELACIDGYSIELKKWGVDVVQHFQITRTILGKKIWLEHGNRFDPYNRIECFGDVNDTPYGYHIQRDIASKIVRLPERNRRQNDWLKGFISIPIESIPYWFFSNYFYRELAPILRNFVAPFLIFFTASTLLFLMAVANRVGIMKFPDIFYLTNYLGPVKYLANAIILFNFLFIATFFILSLIWKLVKRDIKSNLEDYGIYLGNGIKVRGEEMYRTGIIETLATTDDIDVFIYADSHNPYLWQTVVGNKPRLIANSGTWTKSLHPIKSWCRLPEVYYPHFKLAYLTIGADNITNKPELALRFWPKKASCSLTLLERLAILRRDRNIKTKERKLSF